MDWHIPRPTLLTTPYNPDRVSHTSDFGNPPGADYTIPRYARSLQNESVGKNKDNRKYSGTISTYLSPTIDTTWTQTNFNVNSSATKKEPNPKEFLPNNDNKLNESNLQQVITSNGFDLNFDYKKDLKKDSSDSASVASSTHFTMVNDTRDVGQGSYFKRSNKNSKITSPLSFLCMTCEACQGHKLTCLVLTMSFFILTGLAVAILFIEYRARRIQE